MTEAQIEEFVVITKASRVDAAIWLAKYDNDVGAAAAAYLKGNRKPREFFVGGGSHSGIAVLAAPEDGTLPEVETRPPPPPPVDRFAGKGRSLGGALPPAGTGTGAGAPTPTTGPITPVKTDYSTAGAPRTRVRFEMPGQGPLILWVNLNATVGDLKAYFIENYAPAAGHDVTLTVTAPPKELTDDTATVEAAGLKMAMLRCLW
jgi:hypothetical protein